MKHVNMVILVGNTGKLPDLKYLPSGTAVCKCSLATNRKYTKDGEQVKEVEWHNLELWGKTAELFNQMVKAGTPLFVRGRIQTETWETEGVKHYRTKVVVDDFSILSSREGNGQEDEDEGVVIPISIPSTGF